MCCILQLLSKGIVFRSGLVTASSSTQHRLSITMDSALAQKLAPNARIVVWYITARGEIVSDSLDFTVNGAFANEVKNCILIFWVFTVSLVDVFSACYTEIMININGLVKHVWFEHLKQRLRKDLGLSTCVHDLFACWRGKVFWYHECEVTL